MLQDHLNSAQPFIKFIMEVKKNGTLVFLDTVFQRKDDGSLKITVYRMPNHMDWYLDLHTHHLSHVQRGLVRCLFDRAQCVTSTKNDLQMREHHPLFTRGDTCWAIITGNLTPTHTAALEVWGTVTPSYWPETSNRLPSHPKQSMEEPQDSFFALIDSKYCLTVWYGPTPQKPPT